MAGPFWGGLCSVVCGWMDGAVVREPLLSYLRQLHEALEHLGVCVIN